MWSSAGSARVCFFDEAGYIAALKTKFVHLNTSDVNKQVRAARMTLCMLYWYEYELSGAQTHAAQIYTHTVSTVVIIHLPLSIY